MILLLLGETPELRSHALCHRSRGLSSSFVVTKWAERISQELSNLESPRFTLPSTPTSSTFKPEMVSPSTSGRKLSRKNHGKWRLGCEFFGNCWSNWIKLNFTALFWTVCLACVSSDYLLPVGCKLNENTGNKCQVMPLAHVLSSLAKDAILKPIHSQVSCSIL